MVKDNAKISRAGDGGVLVTGIGKVSGPVVWGTWKVPS